MNPKKAQIKMFETIAVIIVFFFILVFGLVYYNSTQQREIRNMIDEDRQLRAIEIMKITTYLPELQCSIDNVLTTNCIDLTKLQNFKEVSDNNRLYYTSMFSYGKIYVQRIYPEPAAGEEKEYILYLNDKTKSKDKVASFIPILIYNPLNRKYLSGVLVVELYQ
jgi:hypothetical protein